MSSRLELVKADISDSNRKISPYCLVIPLHCKSQKKYTPAGHLQQYLFHYQDYCVENALFPADSGFAPPSIIIRYNDQVTPQIRDIMEQNAINTTALQIIQGGRCASQCIDDLSDQHVPLRLRVATTWQ
ncbi:hypothetical protein BGZ99_007733 [Dissophora globulifera]|uniref:Uncharacterized protein n=1 Tax=Dissophora globulifera TaxID=979702 RepID=A0A9P6UZH4_9FUNG|nr:hypothetical protein BGZ99_007733 [Dissophora globulifera]